MRYSVSTNFRLELIEPPAREEFLFFGLLSREQSGRGEEKKTWLKPSETQSSVRPKKNFRSSTFLADGFKSSVRKLLETLCIQIISGDKYRLNASINKS